MKRGPKPKPIEVKMAEGNRGKRRLDPGIQLPAKPFDPPFQLGAIAQREWDRVMSFGYWLRESESVAIADRCVCFQRIQEAEEEIRRNGFTVMNRGREVANPAIRIAKYYRDAMDRWDQELYLKPFCRPNDLGDTN